MTSEEAANELSGIRIVAAPLYEESKILHDPHVAARQMLNTVEGFDQPIPIVASPVYITGLQDTRSRLAPVGHDTLRLMREAGYDSPTISRLSREGIVNLGG